MRLRVLVVSRSTEQSAAWVEELEQAGCAVGHVIGVGRALELLKRRPEVDVIVSALRLGDAERDGLDVLEAVGVELPGVGRLLVGTPVVQPLESVILAHGPLDRVVWPPLDPGVLAAVVAELGAHERLPADTASRTSSSVVNQV